MLFFWHLGSVLYYIKVNFVFLGIHFLSLERIKIYYVESNGETDFHFRGFVLRVVFEEPIKLVDQETVMASLVITMYS